MPITLTDRSYRVLRLARRQADARHADQIATRDILDALGLEGSGVAANVMRTLRLSFIEASAEESLAQARGELLEQRIEPDTLFGEAHELWNRAQDEAVNCCTRWHNPPLPSAWLGTEHWLLAITTGNEESGTLILRDALSEIGLTLADVRNRVLEFLGKPKGS